METVLINDTSVEPHKQNQFNMSSNTDSTMDTLNVINENNECGQNTVFEKVEKEHANTENQCTSASDESQTNLFNKHDNETIKLESDTITKDQSPLKSISYQQFQSTTNDSIKCTDTISNDGHQNNRDSPDSEMIKMKSFEECQQNEEFNKPENFLIASCQDIDDAKKQCTSKKLDCSIENEYLASSISSELINKKDENTDLLESKIDDDDIIDRFSDADIKNYNNFSSEDALSSKSATFESQKLTQDNNTCEDDVNFQKKTNLQTPQNNQEIECSDNKTTFSSNNSFQNENMDKSLDPSDNNSENVSLKITTSVSDTSVESSPTHDLQDNEDSSSSFRSAITKRSISSTSSSQQLVIDHSLDDTENTKLAPLKLSFKRKARNNSGSQTVSKDIPNNASENHDDFWNKPNQLKSSLTNSTALMNISTKPSNEGFEQLQTSKESGSAISKYNIFDTDIFSIEHKATCDQQTKQNKLKTRYYKCMHCTTFHEEWNFFNHVRDHHNRFICFYCLRLFSTAERLSLHMENKHDLEQNHFNTTIVWNISDSQECRNLTCCMCQHVFKVNESFVEHNCSEFLQPCGICGQRGRHTNHCKYNNGRNVLKKRTRKKLLVPPDSQLPPDKHIMPSSSGKESSNNSFIGFENCADTLYQQSVLSNNGGNTIIDETCNTNINQAENTANGVDMDLDPPIPKLVIPKIMLRVPKEYQKSVDAEFSYTDSEEFDEDELDEHNSTTQSVEDATNITDQTLPLFDIDTNSATETATEASILNERSAQMAYENPGSQDTCEDSLGSTNANLTRILDEIKQTQIQIIQCKDEALNKRELNVNSNSRKNTGSEVDQIWSPTPPASPQSRGLTPGSANCKMDIDVSGVDKPLDQNLDNHQSSAIENMSDEHNEQTDSTICEDSKSLSIDNSFGNQEMTTDKSVNESHPNFIESTAKDTMEHENSDTAGECTNNNATKPLTDAIEIANEDILSVELQLDRPLDKFETVEFIRLCHKSVVPLCLYCNHARRIAVNAKSLVLHLIAQHRFTATVDSITAEELQAETIVTKLKSFLNDLENEYLNSASYCTIGDGAFTSQINERVYECFQCRFVTSTHKELYMHNRRLHIKTAILCFMCRLNFYSFSEILCHICPGAPTNASIFDVKYRCCLCDMTNLPSPFRLMVHLRKKHFACDVCLEDCGDQSKLSSHVWKHKLHHLCYRCGIAYRNKQDITKHLYWKHGTESIKCKRCLQKRWRHVYHFCVPPTSFVCDECNLCFSKAMYLEVHKRIHSGDLRYPCTEEDCKDIFVSRRLLLKHNTSHHSPNTTDLLTAKTELDTETKTTQPEVNDTLSKIKIDSEVTDAENGKGNLSPDKSESKPTGQEVKQNSKTNEEMYRKKRKKNKNSKMSLEDLNLIAPNLSESDSFDESDTDCKLQDEKCSLSLPKVVLSPMSESDGQVSPKSNNGFSKDDEEEKIPDIWKNLLQGNNASYQENELTPTKPVLTAPEYPMPKVFHVCVSDHDYCKMFRPQTPTPSKSPSKSLRKTGKSQMQNSGNLSSDISSESSSSSDSSSCSCGSNCSCSSSDSESSSSSSSSNNSNLSNTSKTPRKRQRKKSKKCASPLKPLQTNSVEVNGVSVEVENTNTTLDPKSPPFNESDLETAESETDEEFYDEHPQKLANELLAQKRAALMAQTRLSPSHNFDIVENSRPSTPSLPDELSVFGEKRIKSKKKKRERKSSTKVNQKTSVTLNISVSSPTTQDLVFPSQFVSTSQNGCIYDGNSSHGHLSSTLPTYTTSQQASHATGTFNSESVGLSTITRPFAPLANLSIKHRSEGSSCSDPDASLKRSKRTRRPNKFYGYSSDDENMSTVLAPPLMVGMQLIKPQPPPQLTWAKEDLPAPSKSLVNHKNRASRISKTPTNSSHVPHGGKKIKRTSTLEDNSQHKRKRHDRSAVFEDTTSLPPIPTLKIKSSQLFAVQDNNSDESSETSSDDEVDDNVFDVSNSTIQIMSTDNINETVENETNNAIEAAKTILPVPEATVFKQKIPPALLPNPDFTTLQYFKANNIRYPIRPPAGARLAREGEAVYCYCRCPYDEVSEMIACDGENCLIEWFHFECVGIMLAPQGKWFCAECRPKYSEELYPTSKS